MRYDPLIKMNPGIPADPASLAAIPDSCPDFWTHWGFESWQHGNMAGVSRIQRFVKGGFLGKIAEYRALDYIVWKTGTADEREDLWRSIKPLPDVMTQRFLFLAPTPWEKRRIRSFCFGFRGFLEFHAFWPSEHTEKTDPADLTDLVHLALQQKPVD